MRRQKKKEVSFEQRHIPMSHHFSGKLFFMYLYLLQQLTARMYITRIYYLIGYCVISLPHQSFIKKKKKKKSFIQIT